MKDRILVFFIFFLPVVANAQPKLSFDKMTKDFGTILWNNPATAEFKLTNTGNSVLQLTAVNPSCACTAVDWPKSGIKPSETVSIKVLYDAKALGTFYKDIEVTSNASPEPVYLEMSGRVVASAQDVTNTSGFGVVMGDVRLSKDILEFNQVSKGNDPVDEIVILNPTRAAFEPILMHVPDYLEVSCYPQRIPAGKTGRVRIKVLTDKIPAMGLTQTSIYLSRGFGDKVSLDNEIMVSVILLPDFSNLSSLSKEQMPKLQVSATDLTILTKGKNIGKGVVMVTNAGKSDLKIDRLQVLSTAVSVSIPKKVIPAGQTMKMKVQIDKSKIRKNRKPGLLMITNDPEHAEQLIYITTD